MTMSPVLMPRPMPPHVPTRIEPPGAQSEQLLDDDRDARRAHAARLDADGHALVRSGVAEQAAMGVDLAGRRRVRRRTSPRSRWRGSDRPAGGRSGRSPRARREGGSAASGCLPDRTAIAAAPRSLAGPTGF